MSFAKTLDRKSNVSPQSCYVPAFKVLMIKLYSSIIVELQDTSVSNKLEMIRKHLHLEPFQLQHSLAELRKHRSNIAAEFRDKNWYTGQKPQDRLLDVKKSAAYSEWLNTSQSRLLVVSGENDVTQAPHCWVSPLALDLIEQLNQNSLHPSKPFTFYLLGHRESDESPQDVVASLILRFLSIRKDLLQSPCYDELWSQVQAYDDELCSPNHSLHKIQEALDSVVLKAFNLLDSNEAIWIVLDRGDKCQLPGLRHTGSRTLLRTMVRLVERSKATVKILCVVNRADWRIENDEADLGAEEDGTLVIHRCKQS